MELLSNDGSPAPRVYSFVHKGSGSSYFGIVIVNMLLSIVTLGLYYPWAKARKLQYLYGATEFNDSRFEFHGTGAEMFKGFIKAILLIAVLYAMVFTIVLMRLSPLLLIIPVLGFMAIIPLAIHGSYKYRMSRTSWRGIRFGYRGNRGELFGLSIKGLLLTIVTLGIYGSWFTMSLRNYVLGNIRFGNAEFKYKGNGGEFFVLNLKGYLLTLFTLGIYMFWWQKDLFAYYVNNLSLQRGNENIKLKCTATGGDFFAFTIVNLLLVIFTLGIALPWVMIRTLKFICSKIEVTGNVNFEALTQTEAAYTDATGEDVSDMLDLGFVI